MMTPSDDDVRAAAAPLLSATPRPSQARLLAALLSAHPEWTLDEARLSELLPPPASGDAPDGDDDDDDEADDGQAPSGASGSKKKKKKKPKKSKAARAHDAAVPVSHIDASVELPAGVRAHYFDAVKGKGLVADRDFAEGDVVWVEDAWVAAPPAIALAGVWQGELCGQCFLPIEGARLAVRCGGSCTMRFCNRVCEQRGQSTHHRLLCVRQNPSSKPFLDYLGQHKWLSLHSVARALARVLLTHSSTPPPSVRHGFGPATARPSTMRGMTAPGATLDETLEHLNAFASVSELQRRSRNPAWDLERSGFESAMREGLRLLRLAIDPWDESVKDKGNKGVVRQFPEKVARDLFSWEGFLRHLGRANLNTEAQGGMYLVHSMLNHACDPNLRVSHPPQRSIRQATKIGVLATRAIAAGEELFISYQSPDLSLARRRLLLWREYLWGPCTCARCLADLEQLAPAARREHEAAGGWKHDEHEAQEVQRRREHAQRLDALEEQRRQKLLSEGKDPERNLDGLADEIRERLGL